MRLALLIVRQKRGLHRTSRLPQAVSHQRCFLTDIKGMNLDWNEGSYVEGPHGPHRVSQRNDIYEKYADDLIDPCISELAVITRLRS